MNTFLILLPIFALLLGVFIGYRISLRGTERQVNSMLERRARARKLEERRLRHAAERRLAQQRAEASPDALPIQVGKDGGANWAIANGTLRHAAEFAAAAMTYACSRGFTGQLQPPERVGFNFALYWFGFEENVLPNRGLRFFYDECCGKPLIGEVENGGSTNAANDVIVAGDA